MSKKPTISSITSGYTSTTALNANFEALRDGFDNTLSLDGSTPNAMNADFDMNSNDILNAKEVNASSLRLDGVLVSASSLNSAGATLYSDNYTGDGSTVSYTMSYQPFIKDNTQVYIDGVYQNKAGYETSGTTLTFSEAPPLNSNIEIVVARSLDVAGTSSANVDYNQGGPGAVTTTVESKLQEFVSVKDFGAVGDGVTDDTAAIQAALNECKSSGSPLYVGKGRFLITSTILIPTETSIIGVGGKIGTQTVPQTAFISNSLGSGVWMFDGEEATSTNYQNTTIKDCAFVCEGSDVDSAYGLRFRGKGCYVERCFFSNNAIGIRNNAVENWYLYNYFNSCGSICIDDAGGECHIIGNHGYGGSAAGGSMIQLRQKNSVVALNKFFGDTNSTDYGIEIWGSHNIIADNVMDNMEVAAYYFNTSNASEDIVGNVITGSALNSGYNGVANNCAVLMDASSHNIYENVIDVNAQETRGTPSMEHMYRLVATGAYSIDRNHLKGTVNTASVTGSVIEASGANVGSFNKVDIAGYKTVREWEETVSNGGTVNHGLDVIPSFVAMTARSNNVYSVGYDLENATSFRFLGRDNTGTALSSVPIRFRASREYV